MSNIVEYQDATKVPHSFNVDTIIRKGMCRDQGGLLKAANLLQRLLNASLFPVRFEVNLTVTGSGMRATIYGSEIFSMSDVERALFGKEKEPQDTALF